MYHLRRKYVQTEVGQCLLSFGAESFSSSLLSKNAKMEKYRTIILSLVLYGCGTWSLTFRKERNLRVFENRMLRRKCEDNIKMDRREVRWEGWGHGLNRSGSG